MQSSKVKDFILQVVVTPAGHLLVERCDGEQILNKDLKSLFLRIESDFKSGVGHGLLQLGLREVKATLPPDIAYWRDYAATFLSSLCHLPDLEKVKRTPEVPCPNRNDLKEKLFSLPPMQGAEYVTVKLLESYWHDIARAIDEQLQGRTISAFLNESSELWHNIGRVHFHLAENKRSTEKPFAFLATYTTGLSNQGQVRHLPLGNALREFVGEKARTQLLSLLRPVHSAAQASELVKQMVEDKTVFYPQSWNAAQAHAFLSELSIVEKSGIITKVPDWWSARDKRRPRVSISLGNKKPSHVGLTSLLDFKATFALGGQKLSEEELRSLLKGSEGLRYLKGQWVEVDHEQVKALLESWEELEFAKSQGMTMAEALRLLAGASSGRELADDAFSLHKVRSLHAEAGKWLRDILEKLGSPKESKKLEFRGKLKTELRPYQRDGVIWLNFLRQISLGGCLADDMGLGKTVQVIALLLLINKDKVRPSLLVVPASLVANWKAEMERFSPSLNILVAHSSVNTTKEMQKWDKKVFQGYNAVITSYGVLRRLPLISETEWDLVVLDEAQAIKNPTTSQTKCAKQLRSAMRLALTGTPVENRLSDLWSIFDFINPGLLGGRKSFGSFVNTLQSQEPPDYSPLRRLVSPYVLRRKKNDPSIISDLPDKTEVNAWCTLSKRQAALYKRSVDELSNTLKKTEDDKMKRRGLVFAYLTRFKQICNHPDLWLSDSQFREADSGKFLRLRELCETISSRQDKALIFTQYKSMCQPLAYFLASVFGRNGVVLHGSTPVKKRAAIVKQFQEDDRTPFFVVSLKAGGTGLNLTAASHVIHFDRWWNPAVENQATDRAYRIGQHKNVLVHKFVCRGTIEEKIDKMLAEKQSLAEEVLGDQSEVSLTELSNEELIELVSLDIERASLQN